MIETLTKNYSSKKEKIIKIISNFRSDTIFAKTAFKFFIKEYLGENGPTRLKQAAYLAGYLVLMGMI